MQIGIVGLPYTGKTTVFNALTGLSAPTGKYIEGQGETHRGVVHVPDDRLGPLAEIYRPKKTTPASIEFFDVAGLKKGASADAALSSHLLGYLRDTDALAVVVRVFERESVPHPEGRIAPAADLETLLTELSLADLAVAEKRLLKLAERLRKGEQEDRDKHTHEKEILERIVAALGEGEPIRSIEFHPDERAILQGFGFLSQKPALILANVGDLTHEVEQQRVKELEAHCDRLGLRWLSLNSDLECELRRIEDPAEQEEFMEAMGISEHAIGPVIRAMYEVTRSITFFTGNEREVHAWTLPEGGHAIEAAAKVHTDMARGFIRAEVVPFESLVQAGSFAHAREAGHYREEGKDAVVHDGEVIHFRFNV